MLIKVHIFFSHKFVGHLCLQQDTSMILFLQLNIRFILVILLVVTLFFLLANLLILSVDIISNLTFNKLLPYITPSLSFPRHFLSVFLKCTFNLSRKKLVLVTLRLFILMSDFFFSVSLLTLSLMSVKTAAYKETQFWGTRLNFRHVRPLVNVMEPKKD